MYSSINAGSSVTVGTDVGAAMRNVNASAYVRIPFTVTDPSAFDALLLKMRYDDGFVAYLNGVEVARRNAPTALDFDSAATADRSLQDATTPETINLTPFLNLLQSGNNVLAIQGLNSSPGDDSFLILPELTASAVHPDQLRYFATVTPGDPNIDPSLGVIERVSSSVGAGFYDAPIYVSLATPSAGAEIRYTIDGSTPSATNGFVYSRPVAITSTTTLRAGAFRAGYVSLPTITRTYIFLDDVIGQSPSDDVSGGDPDVGAPPPGWPDNWGNNVVDYGIDQTVVQQEGADKVKAALLAIPTLSITTDLANLFDPSTGIYANAYNDGRDWERPASVELLNPDGTPGFQVNAGLRIRGGYSRSGDNPKHAFRLFFRGEYGDSTLDYPLFGSEGVDSFKKMDLRTAQNYSWSFGGDPSNTMIQDVFERESQGAMGEPYTRSQWYHLYIDGQYWGIYQTQERAEADYAASYLGGTAANYDVIKPEAGPYTIYATDGNLDAYHQLWQFVTTQNMADNANYFHIQGMNVNGIADPSIPNQDVLLDVDNLIVYMIGTLHGGNLDAPISAFLGNEGVNNFFAVRDRTGRTGFQYFQHDAEHTLHNIYEDRNGPFPAGQDFNRFNPQFLHQQLMANAEYRQKFADAVEKYFFNDGAMTVANSEARFQKHVDALDQAIIAESARWGDSKRPTDPLGRADWLNAVVQMQGFLANRNDIFLQQLRDYGLFPNLSAPQFLVNGAYQNAGEVTPGSLLRFAASGGLVYYTLDGSDPRLIGGGINPAALIYDPGTVSTTVLASGSVWKYFDQGSDLGTAWRSSTYNDSSWSSGPAELGYGDGDEATTVSYGADPSNKFNTTYFRTTFNVADTSALTGLTLRLKRDDGAVVYINGVEAVRSNMPSGTISAGTLAAATVGGSDEQTFYEYQIDPSLLVAGVNVIAVEIHQSVANSSDISFDAQLITSTQTSAGIPLNSSKNIKARTYDGANWSALEQATFSTAIPAASGNLAVTEINYNPVADPGSPAAPFNDKENFEFIELRNTGTHTIDLTGVKFTVGITYDFTGAAISFLAPGESVLVVKNQQAFEHRYGTGLPVAGVYSGNLSNGGEQIKLIDATGATIQDFTYDDEPTSTPPWPVSADGGGYSLTVRNVAGDYNSSANWRASLKPNGTPGVDEHLPPENLALKGKTVSENAPFAVVGTLSATDADVGDTATFSILPGGDAGQFVIVGNELRVGSTGLDYEAGATRSITIRATDSFGLFVDKAFTINVSDVPEGTVVGTAGDDLFELTYVSANLVSIRVNGVSLGSITASQFDLNGLGGNDTLIVTGTSDADQFVVGAGTFEINQVQVNFQQFEIFSIDGHEGLDRVTVAGTAADDVLALSASALDFNGLHVAMSGIEQFAFQGNGGNDEIRLGEQFGTISLLVALTSPAASAVAVPFQLSGTATQPSDFSANASPLTIPAGKSVGQVDLSILDDLLGELDETISIAFDAPSNGSLAGATIYTVTIVDNDPPSSAVNPLPALTTTTDIPLSWTGTADAVAYDVYVSDNDSPFSPFVLGTTSTTGTFTGVVGHTYRFYSVAVDDAGNVETFPSAPDTGTTIGVPVAPVSVAQVSPDPRSSAVSSLTVTFSREIDPTSLTAEDFTLTRNGGPNLLKGNEPVTGSGKTFRIANLAALTRADGDYVLTVKGAGVLDLFGNPGSGSATRSWGMDSGPFVTQIVPVTPNVRETSVDSIDVTFSEAIDPASFTLANLNLSRNNSRNLITSGVSIAPLTGNTWRISGLAGITTVDGSYRLEVNSVGIRDTSGHVGDGLARTSWTLKRVPPTITSLSPVNPNRTNAPVDSFDVTFSEAIDPATVSVTDFVLTRNGATVAPPPGASFTLVSGNTWRIAGLADATNVDGPYRLMVDTRGMTDVNGVAGTTTRSVSWTQDFTAPTVKSIKAVSPNARNTPVGSIEFTFSEKVQTETLGLADFTLTRDGLPVSWTSAQSIEFVTGTTWRLVGLESLTADDGDYVLTVDASGVVDTAGNTGQAARQVRWKMDTQSPTSSIVPFASSTAASLSIPLAVTGSDRIAPNGAVPSGARYYDVFVSTDGGAFVLWTTLTASSTQTTIKTTYPAASDHTYAFHSVARDAAGNVEPKGAGVIEASIVVPDLSGPATSVTRVDTTHSTFVITMQGSDIGSNGRVDTFALSVSIDGAPAKRVAVVSGGAAGADGTYSAQASFRALADGATHSYRFYSIGKDGAGNAERSPASPADIIVTGSFTPDQVTGFDVEKGAQQRSLVRSLDLVFSRPDDVAAMIATIGDGIGGNDALRLRQFNLGGGLVGDIPLSGRLSVTGNTVQFDLGPSGLASGYYELGVDLDGNGTLDQFLHFHRLQGDFSGDGKVDGADASLLAGALGQSGLGNPYDINLSGLVDASDQSRLKALLGRRLADGLPLDD